MSEEKLELVTEFSSLRACDLVVVKDCRFGDGDHCGLLLRYVEDTQGWGPTGIVLSSAWTTTVIGFHGFRGCMLGGPGLVAQSRVYRVRIPPVAETRETSHGLPQNEVAKNIRKLLAEKAKERAR